MLDEDEARTNGGRTAWRCGVPRVWADSRKAVAACLSEEGPDVESRREFSLLIWDKIASCSCTMDLCTVALTMPPLVIRRITLSCAMSWSNCSFARAWIPAASSMYASTRACLSVLHSGEVFGDVNACMLFSSRALASLIID